MFQADRWSRKVPTVAAVVPEGLGGFADATRVQMREMTNPGSGLELAKQLVALRPIPAPPLRALGNSAMERDQADLASKALTLAAERGWRDTFTQLTILASAIEAGEWDIAAQRADALARTARDQQLIEQGLAFLIAESEGRKAVAGRLNDGAPLTDALVALIRSDESQISQVIQVYSLADAMNSNMSCASFAKLTNFLLLKGRGVEAIQTWPDRCRSRAAADLAFNLDEQINDPLAWRFPSSAGLIILPGEADGSVDVRNRSMLRQEFARKFLTLSRGGYTLTLKREGGGDNSKRRSEFDVSLSCDRGRTIFAETIERSFSFEIPGDCTTQLLAISASRGAARSVRVSIDAS